MHMRTTTARLRTMIAVLAVTSVITRVMETMNNSGTTYKVQSLTLPTETV